MASIPKTLASGTSDVAIHQAGGKLAGVLVTQVTAPSLITLFDNASAASGQIVFKVTAPVGSTFYPLPDVMFSNGLFADRDAANAQEVTVYLAQ